MTWVDERRERFEHYLITSYFKPLTSPLFGVPQDETPYAIDFVVVEISGESIDPNPGALLYTAFGDGPTNEMTEDPDQADVFLSGMIKWDGCSNWNFDAQEKCMLHFCGVQQATSIGRLMGRLYDIAAERLPTFDRHLARMPLPAPPTDPSP